MDARMLGAAVIVVVVVLVVVVVAWVSLPCVSADMVDVANWKKVLFS